MIHACRTLSTTLLAAAFMLPCTAGASEAICEIHSAGEQMHRVPCAFSAEKGGSFTVESVKKDGALYGNILMISLYVTEKGKGEVFGLTKDGINSRWGEAVREGGDSPCWKGEDFRLCVRAR